MKAYYILIAVLLTTLVGCAGCASCDVAENEAVPSSSTNSIELTTLVSSQYCGSTTSDANIVYASSLSNLPPNLLTQFANVRMVPTEMIAIEGGQRSTGGYGFTVQPTAIIENRVLKLTGEWSQPAPGMAVTQAFSSPCVVIQAPAGDYDEIELRDVAGTLHARKHKIAVNAAQPKTEFSP